MPVAFGRYRVKRRLGAGGMGAVYLAGDESLGRDVAVKVLRPLGPPGEPPPADLVERFRREARAVALLSHPGIVRVYDQGVDPDGLPFLVMELVTGPTLAERIEQGGALSVREVRTLGIQMASALEVAHAAGIVHRDVKPSNVLSAGGDRWKLADFGIARTLDSSLTITGQFLGTPSFAAPEALEGGVAGAAADVFSLGATLYAALVGEPPYGSAGLAQVVVAMAQGQRPEPVAARRGDVPPGIAEVIDRALALGPEQRPGAAELAHALAVDESVAGARSPGGASVAVAAEPVAARVASRSGRRALLPILLAAGVALVIGLAIGGGGGSTPARPGTGSFAPGVGLPGDVAAGGGSGAGAADDPPPWQAGPPAAAERRGGGPPGDIDKHWRKAYDRLQEGDWERGAHELEEVLKRDPDDPTAQAWLDWMDRAARDGRLEFEAGPHGDDDRGGRGRGHGPWRRGDPDDPE